MTTLHRLGSTVSLLLLLSAWPLLAQTTPRPTSPAPGSTTTRPTNQRGLEGRCLQQAGVSRQAMEQHRQISENARSQISAVCSDSSLSAQQKHQRIQEIHQQAKQQMESVITPQQHQALEACRQKQGGGHHGVGGGHRGGGEVPCGELPSANGGKPFDENDLDEQ